MMEENGWICADCGSYNIYHYPESAICEICQAPISKEENEKCIYKIADIFCRNAVLAEDFAAAAECFSKIPQYKDSMRRCEECVQKAQKILLYEKNDAEATQHWESARSMEELGRLADAEKEYALAEQQFKGIIPFKASRLNWIKCRQARIAVHQKRIYDQANALFVKASTIADYQNAAHLFSEILEFSDAEAKQSLCLKRLEEIKIEQQYQDILEQKTLAQKETDLDRQAWLYRSLIDSFEKKALSEKAKKEIEQCSVFHNECLKQIEERNIKELFRKASAKCEAADALSDSSLRAAAYSKILAEYKDYAETEQFAPLICACRNQLAAANSNIAYDAAVARMNKAGSEGEFLNAASAFSALSGFKDCDEKKALCVNYAKECKQRDCYDRVIRKICQSKKITMFNWRKYR